MNLFYKKAIEKSLKLESLETTIIIIPNRRSKTFIKEIILSKIKKVSISPEIYSIDDFIERIADSQESDKTSILFYLYESFMETSKNKDFESYHTFRKWANILLDDINDIQMSGANHIEVFDYLIEIKKISLINNNDKSTLEFWEMIPKIINLFISKLKTNKIYNKGLVHLEAQKNIEYYSNAHKAYDFIILGLNSLSNVEANIVEYLLSNNKSKIYWDCDKSFTNNTISQMGYFFRKYKNEWDYFKTNSFEFEHSDLSREKNINIYPAIKNINQVNIISKILGTSKGRTALILPNKNLLLPVLNAIPKKVKSFNLSTSFPLNELPLISLFNLIFEMYGSKGGGSFYYKDVLRITQNNIFNLIFNDQEEVTNFNSSITNLNLTYLSRNFIKSLNLKDLEGFFSMNEKTIIDQLVVLCDICEKKLEIDKFYEQILNIRKILYVIKSFIEKYKFKISFESLKEIFNDILRNQSLSLYGDLKADIQIMGFLESRGLEFENIIICSANEGILPKNNFSNSLLSYDLRKKYNIPSIDEADAREAYDFFRLLFKAKNISLVYNSIPEGISGEKSRFIYQLELLKNPKHRINYISSNFDVPSNAPTVYSYKKSNDVIKKLTDFANYGFSPSSLINYIDDPLTFFDIYLLRTKEVKKVIENPEAIGFGRIFHNATQDLYRPLKNQTLTITELKTQKKRLDEVLKNRFYEEYGRNDLRGKNIVAHDVLKMAINQLIDMDIKKINSGIVIKIVSIEDKISADFITHKSKIKYKLRGFIDRVQTENGELKIIDYKTGGAITPSSLNFDEFEQAIDKKKKELFQLLCYSLIYLESNKKVAYVEPGLVLLKSINSGTKVVRQKTAYRKYNSIFDLEGLSSFKLLVDDLVEEIFDKNLNFESN